MGTAIGSVDAFQTVLPPSLQAVARGGIASSQAMLNISLRRLHRRILLAFVASGGLLRTDECASMAIEMGIDPGGALRCLDAADLVHADGTEWIRIAHPFTDHATQHTVELKGCRPLRAPCAIDALGAFVMMDTDGLIRSTDMLTGDRILIERSRLEWLPTPSSVVVVLGAVEGCCGPIATACATTGFHSSQESGQEYLARTVPKVVGRVLEWPEAIAVAVREFGPLLSEENDV